MTHDSHRIYLDYAASTPADSRVYEAMMPYWSEHFGNAGGIHEEARVAKRALEEARASIAAAMGVHAFEVTFTSGGTEANNLALLGRVRAARRAGNHNPHVVISAIEHASVGETKALLEEDGVAVSVVPVDEAGRVSPQQVAALLRPETVLVSIVYVSNEVGTIQPLREISHVIRKYEEEQGTAIAFHTDASQAGVFLPIRLEALGVDMLTIDAQKLYGPKGVGALAHRARIPLLPIMVGGSQERGLRPGTPNVPLVVGLASALSIAETSREEDVARVTALRDRFIDGVHETIIDAVLNGPRRERVANNANISFPGVDAELLVAKLDQLGVACATRSACLTEGAPGSEAVRALGKSEELARSAVRFSFGRPTTKEDVEEALRRLAQAVASVRR